MNQLKKLLLAIMSLCIAFTAVSCSPTVDTDEKGEISESEEAVAGSDDSTDIISELGLTAEPKDATTHTVEINSAFYSMLDFSDTSEAENASRGLIDAPETLELRDENGDLIWSMDAYSFLDDYEKAPDTVNPSLWENAKNNYKYGLFKVADGIYQVRGYDIANLTLIEGDTGWIIFDTMYGVECTSAAMQLVEKNLGKRPIKAIVISHSHADHFGGIAALMDRSMAADKNLPISEQIASGKIPIIVPENFEEYVMSENVYAGKGMGRRANYQYGVILEPSVKGRMSMGIAMAQSTGTLSYISPTYKITYTGETLTIDGIRMEFQLTPGSEAPSEMNTWFPDMNALWLAENCTGTLHNLYTLRGAQVRDGAAWAGYITEALTLYGDKAEVAFQSHNWPHWGNKTVKEYMTDTAAVYKFINDETLGYINQGYTPNEISAVIKLPKALEKNWYTRQYYGTLSHNCKAVYQKYMGWYDANPVNLDPLTPSESAKKWVEYLGDIDEVLRKAKEDFDNGEYQWVAEVTNAIVFAEPDNTAARLLCADALEQLGYQSESGTWRNAYLCGASELRNGNMSSQVPQTKTTGALQLGMSARLLFDNMGIILNGDALRDKDFKIAVEITDLGESYTLHIHHGVLLVYENYLDASAQVSVKCPKAALYYITGNNYEGVASAARIEGDAELLKLFMSNLNKYPVQGNGTFNIVEP